MRRHGILVPDAVTPPQVDGGGTVLRVLAGGLLTAQSLRALSNDAPTMGQQLPPKKPQGGSQRPLSERVGPWVKGHPVATVAGLIGVQVLGSALADWLLQKWGLSPASVPLQLSQAQSTAPLMVAPPKAIEAVAPAIYAPPADARWLRLAPHPSVILVLGRRGSGKSALGYRLLELFRDVAAPYVVGLPSNASNLLPEWVGVADSLEDVLPHAVVLIDEAYLQLHARTSMSEAGRAVGPLVNLSRQRGQTLIFIVQEARQLDVNVISQADVVAIKDLSEISREFERRELRSFTDRARAEFSTLKGDRRRWAWVYSESADFSGLVENSLASFWRPALSRAFASGVSPTEPGSERKPSAPPRRGIRTPTQDLAAKAKSLHLAGHSYGTISKILGIPKSSVWDLVNGK